MRSHKELRVYQLSFESAMMIYELIEKFPKKETYALNDQILRSSRSVCGNIAEAFRKRIYPKSFILSLGYLQKLFFDAKMKKYVCNQGETMEHSHS